MNKCLKLMKQHLFSIEQNHIRRTWHYFAAFKQSEIKEKCLHLYAFNNKIHGVSKIKALYSFKMTDKT